LRILPLAARQGRAAVLVLLRARKGAGGGFVLLPPVVLHEGARHERDAESYRPEISAILRYGAAFDIDWQ
jgi:tRNA1(Val) A37 N6-methylase TrmN6